MLDLIGFWTGVTVLTAGLSLFPLALLMMLGSSLIASGIPDTEDACRFRAWFWCNNYHDMSFFGGRICITEVAFGLGGSLSFVIAIMSVVMVSAGQDVATPVECVSLTAQTLSPFFVLVGIVGGGVVGLRTAVKYVYYALKFKEKVEAHVSDTSIHK